MPEDLPEPVKEPRQGGEGQPDVGNENAGSPRASVLKSVLTGLRDRVSKTVQSLGLPGKLASVFARLRLGRKTEPPSPEKPSETEPPKPETAPTRKPVPKKLIVSIVCGVGSAIIFWPILSLVRPAPEGGPPVEKSVQLDLDADFREASAAFAAGDFAKVRDTLPAYLKNAPPSVESSEARYMLAEATAQLRDSSPDQVDLDELVSLYRDAVATDKSNPKAPAFLDKLGSLLAQQQKHTEARTVLDELSREFPNYERTAELSATHGTPEEMAKAAAQLSAQKSGGAVNNDQSVLSVAEKYLEQGNFAEARVFARRLIDSFPDSPALTDAYIVQVKALLAQGKLDDAIEANKNGMLKFPAEARFAALLGDVEFDRGGFEAAFGQFKSAIALSSAPDPALYYKAGMAAQRAGKLAEAQGLFKDLIDKFPSSAQAFDGYFQLANAILEQGDPGKAFELLDRQLSLYYAGTQKNQVLKRMGEFYLSVGLPTKAIDALMEVAAETDDQEARYLMGKAYLLSEESKEALAILQKLDAKKLPEPTASAARLLLAKVQFQMGEIDAAEAELDRVEKERSAAANLEALSLRFKVCLVRNDVPKARKAYNDARQLAEETGGLAGFLTEAGVEWANFLYDQGDYPAALIVLEDVTAHLDKASDQSRSAWAVFQKANCHLNLREYDQAVSVYAEFVKRFPSSEWVKMANTKKRFAEIEGGKEVKSSV